LIYYYQLIIKLTARLFLSSFISQKITTIMSTQEKVEEDRYIRAREAQIAAAKAAVAAADTKAAELAAKSKQLIEAKTASMNEVADLLAQTGDVISEAGLANLADWKHT
jgi:hypothetical protein